MRVFAGTSGYSYPEWRGGFYADGLATAAMLAHYATRLGAVEINNTFYRMPKGSVVAQWGAQVPESFRFVIKASQRLTHHQKLREPGELLGYLWGAIGQLEDKLGAVLFQLPKWVHGDPELLRACLAAIDGRYRAAFEFHHPSWDREDVRAALREHRAVAVAVDQDGAPAEPTPESRTAAWGYVRLRRTSYSDHELEGWVARMQSVGWEEVFAFFKHEDASGPAAAVRLQEIASAG